MSHETEVSKNRRNFIKGSSLLLAGGAIGSGQTLASTQPVHVGGSDALKLGLIGCGRRGTAMAIQALKNEEREVRLSAVADVFEDRLQQSLRTCKSQSTKVDVTGSTRFVGLKAYEQLLESSVDAVILATPPAFRPLHFAQAVECKKHVFAEKPIATDAPGVRAFLAANELAKQRGLSVAVGFQRHHDASYQATIAQLQAGIVGRIQYCRAYWNQGPMWSRERTSRQTELEYQLRNWYYFTWLSGDHLVEQHVHNLDVINWLLGAHPERAHGMGGRQVRRENSFGQIYDHHAVEFTYPGGVRLISMCRQMASCWNAVGEFAHGSEGWADISNGKIYDRYDHLIWENSQASDPQRHIADFIHSASVDRVESTPALNEGDAAAMSTMTAILGRMATYTGKELSWREGFQSEVSLSNTASLCKLSDSAPVCPDAKGEYPLSQPGRDVDLIL